MLTLGLWTCKNIRESLKMFNTGAWCVLLALGALCVAHAHALDPALEEAAERGRNPEDEARAYLRGLDREMGEWNNRVTLTEWGYAANISDKNLRRKLEVNAEAAAFQKKRWHDTVRFDWQNFKDPDLRRQFKKYTILGTAALPPEKVERLDTLVSEMESVYSKAKICDYFNQTNCQKSLEPELVELLQHSRDPNELRHVWLEWRRASGEKVRGHFERYVALSNEAALLNNFTDLSEMWLDPYEAADFRDQVRMLWEQLRPLYEQLHAYVRRHLREQYGPEEVSADGPIPAHLLGNMWSQSWQSVASLGRPTPASSPDVSDQMVQQGYTPLRIFKLSEEFFTSLGLSPMPELFWQRSILEKPTDREIVCHASAWDFYDGKDFRIKQCTRADMEQLFVAHHEMGHIQYFIQYSHQPQVYREGANPGFHEAVGDVMSLSVSTPKHLHKIGLLQDASSTNDADADLNYLYLQALQKVAFLPYAYLMDLWRWDVFSGKITSDDYNCQWWRLREQYQGIEPPVDRTEEDFDPGAKYHIIASVPYIRYFVSFVIQFQFHRALCLEAGEFDPKDPNKPLHQCDIYGSKAAGDKLKAMLQMGSSKPWPEALEAVTGSRKMDASGLLDYFRPLHKWLEEHNAKAGERVGWGPSRRVCVSTRDELERLRKANAAVGSEPGCRGACSEKAGAAKKPANPEIPLPPPTPAVMG